MILLPMYKSFADTFTILYSLLNEGLQIPFTLGSKEDTPSVMLFNKLFTNCGMVLLSRSNNQSAEETYCNSALLRELINKYSLNLMYLNK